MPSPFPNGWFAIATSEEIKSGKAKNIECLGENFVLFRSQSGESFILDAYCPHMGANLGIHFLLINFSFISILSTNKLIIQVLEELLKKIVSNVHFISGNLGKNMKLQ